MRLTSNYGLTVWDSPGDPFSHAQLANNWDIIDATLAQPRVANQVETLATVPVSGNFQGRLVYLTAAASGFPANRLIRYDGAAWASTGNPELQASLPALGNYDGRVIVLTAAVTGFPAWSVLVRSAGTWVRLGTGIETAAAVPTTNNYAGRTIMMTAAAGGFSQFDLVTYNGSAYQKVAPYIAPTPPTQRLIGEITSWAGDLTTAELASTVAVIPSNATLSGWLWCNGALLSRTTYATLFAAIGTRYGVGDGTTTFAIPDLRGRTLVGQVNATATPARFRTATPGGEDVHVTTIAEMPTHDHGAKTGSAGLHSHNIPTWNTAADATKNATDPGGTTAVGGVSTDAAGAHKHSIDPQGDGIAHENMPPYHVVHWLIKYS